MKCRYCSKRMSKKDEVCPRCGKYVAEPDEEMLEDSEPKRELGKNIKYFDMKLFAGDFLLRCIPFGLVPLGIGGFAIYNMRRALKYILEGFVNPNIMRGIILALIGIVIIIFSLCAYFSIRKCFVCVNENGVYGIRPKLFIIPERFEFFYDDITDFTCRIPVAKGIPYVKVEANGKIFRIYGLCNSDASFLASYTRENMPVKRKRR